MPLCADNHGRVGNNTSIISEDVNIANISESSIDINTDNASSAVGVTELSKSTVIIDADALDNYKSNIGLENAQSKRRIHSRRLHL